VPNLGQSVTQTAIRANMEGRARIEGVVALIHESYMDAHGNKVAEDTVFKTPCVVIIFNEAPRYREVQSKSESKHLIVKAYRDRASSQTETWEETRPRTRFAASRQGWSCYVSQGDSCWEKRLLISREKMEM